MANVPSSDFYTRGASNTLFQHQPGVRPETPQHLQIVDFGSYVDGGEFAFAEMTFTMIDTVMDSFQLRATRLNNNAQTIVTAPVGGPFRIIGLALGQKYSFTARAVKSGIAGDWGDPVGETMVSDATIPDAPVITATALNPGALITLVTPTSATDLLDYAVYRSINPSNPENQPGARIDFFTGSTYTDNHILFSDDYYYWVRARDESGNLSAPSNVAGPIFSNPIFGGDIDPPGVPNFAAASATAQLDGRIKLEWPANPPEDSVIGYTILRFESPSGSLVQIGRIFTAASGTITFFDDLATLGVEFGYTASAFDSSGNESAFSTNYVYATAVDGVNPDPPTNGSIFGTLGRVVFNWTRSPDLNVVYYEVQSAYDAAAVTPSWSGTTEVLSTDFTLYGVTGSRESLANNLGFRVRAVDRGGNRSLYLTKIALFQDLLSYRSADTTIPASPYPVSATAQDDGTVELLWPAVDIPDIAGYLVQRLDTLDPNWTTIADFDNRSSGTIRHVADGLEPYAFRETLYRFSVRTRDNSGNLSSLNLLENPSFEDGSSGWSGSGLVSSSAAFREGTLSLRAIGTAGLTQLAVASADRTYSVSIYVKRSDASSHTITLRSRFLSAASAQLSNTTTTLNISDSNFHQVFLEGLTGPANTAFITIQPESDSAQFFWDDAQIEESSVVTPWGNGKTIWLGARDLAPPAQSSGALGLSASGALGAISLYWNNGVGFDFIQSVYEVWRSPSAASGSASHISDTLGQSGGRNSYTDNDPDTNIPTTSHYWLKARDRWDNVSGFLNTIGVSATSKIPSDLNIGAALDALRAALLSDANTIQWCDTLVLDLFEDSSLVGSVTGGVVDKFVGWYLEGLTPNTDYVLTSINFPTIIPTNGVSATSGVFFSMLRSSYFLEAGASITLEVSYNGGSAFGDVTTELNQEVLVQSAFPAMTPWTAGVKFRVTLRTNSSGKGGYLRYIWIALGNSDKFSYWPGPVPIP